MNTDSTTRTYAVTALFRDRESAEGTLTDLTALGIPRESIDIHREERVAGSAEERASPGAPNRFLAGLYDFLMPELDRSYYKTGMERGETVLVVRRVPEAMEQRVVAILEREAGRVEDETPDGKEGDGKESDGSEDAVRPITDTVGQYGGAGSATGEFDRLTGKRVGTPEGLHADEPEDPAGGSPGQATGERDRLTGERIGGERGGHRDESGGPGVSGRRPNRVRLYPE
jgi:hypothetical protein